MPTNSQRGLKKAIGALKDSTKLGLARVSSDRKGIEVVIVKATNHEVTVPKEKHVRTILAAVENRVDAAFCIRTLLKRLAKTRTWTVGLKTLIIIHRILKHDPLFHQELINFGRDRGLVLNVAHLKDDLTPQTWNYSFWVREYALYLEERLECFHVLKYDVDKDQSRNRRLNTPNLLDQLPVLQELLHRLLICKPVGAASSNHLIHYVLSIIAGESVKLYIAITDGILNLVDKYFEMQQHHAVKALEIYRKAGEQASKLSEFFEICRGLQYGQGQKYLKIKPLPESFLIAMENYVKETPEVLALPYTPIKAEGAAPIETPPRQVSDLLTDDNQDTSDQPPSDQRKAVGKLDIDDLICFEEPSEEGSQLNENNSLALAIVKCDNPPLASASTGWELSLCNDAPISNVAAVADNKMSGGLNGLTPQSLLTTNQQMAFNFGQASANPFDVNYNSQGPFYGTSNITPQTNVQMSALPPQQLPYIMQQQPPMAMVGYHAINPSIVANYNQVPTFYGGSHATPSTDMQMTALAAQQTDITQQPILPMVGYNSPKPTGNPFDD